jgi:hypothetical protein
MRRIEGRECFSIPRSLVSGKHPIPSAFGAPMHAIRGEMRRSFDRRDWDMLAAEALELARQLPPGPKRNEALKAAGRLRCCADARGIAFAKRGRPRK